MSDNDLTKGDSQLDTQAEPAQLDDNPPAKRKTLDLTSSSESIVSEVCNPITREEKLTKHTVYTVRGHDKEGAFETIRRYSDFDKIRSLLVIRWPGVYIPPLPPKKTVSKMEPKFIEERKRALDQFIKNIAAIPFLHYSEEFQMFLRSSTPDLEKSLQIFQKINYEELINKYTSTFQHLGGRDLTNETVLKISAFKLFLTKTKGHFENFRKISKNLATARKSYYGQLSLFHQMTCVPYEKNVFSEYHGNKPGKNVFFDTIDPKVAEVADRLKGVGPRESLEYIAEYIDLEGREIDAFLEAMNQREKYDTLKLKTQEKQKSETDDLHKVVSGKKSMKQIFTKKTKDEEVADLEKTIAALGKTYDELNSLHDMMTLILSYDEIEKFRRTRIAGYYKVLGIGGSNELKNLDDLNDYWGTILTNENITEIDAESKRL